MTESNWEKLACNLCGSKDYKILYKSNFNYDLVEGHFSQYSVYADIVRCNNCSLVYESPREKIDIINERLMKEAYPIKELAIEEREKFFRLNIKRMKKNIPVKGRLLDIGCNIGDFLNLMRKEGLDIYGIEPSRSAAERAREYYGLNVINDVADNAIENFEDNFFDIVTIWDVIEHLSDPCGVLNKVNKKLKKGGYVCIATHNIDSLFAKATRSFYPHLMYQHLYHFSDKTLKAMLDKAGFQIVKSETFNKMWSVKYLMSLLKDFFPTNKFICRISDDLNNISKFMHLQNLMIVVPIYNDMSVYAKKKL